MNLPARALRLRSAVAIGFVLACLPLTPTVAVAVEPAKDRVLDKLEATVAELRTAGVELTDADFEPSANDAPPAEVTAAGPEFAAAWREYRRATSIGKKLPAKVLQQRRKNVFGRPDEYQRLYRELLEGRQAPTPEQLGEFFHDDYSDCGTGSGGFSDANEQAILLACLRHRRFGGALELLLDSSRSSKLRDDLLTALGFDRRKVIAGAWLDGRSGMLGLLCQDRSDEVAQLALRWAELHWDSDQDTIYPTPKTAHKPRLPALELRDLLAADNAVAPATKERIAAFLLIKAESKDAGFWLGGLPEGAARWLKPIARMALQHEGNNVRRLGEMALRAAGEADVRAELRPDVNYRLFVNGKLWVWDKSVEEPQKPRLMLRWKSGQNVWRQSKGPNWEGVITINPDMFTPAAAFRFAHLDADPSGRDASPADAWIHAPLALPPAFGQTTDVRVQTVEVTITPHFPRAARVSEATVTEIDFGRAEEGSQPGENSCVYHSRGAKPLILRLVQAGDYWLRVRSSDLAASDWEKIQITKAKKRFEPELKSVSTVSVPLKWPERLPTEALDPDVTALFMRSSWRGLPGFFTLERDGKAFPQAATDEDARASQPQGEVLTLRNLPVGKYRLRLNSSAEVRAKLEPLPKPEHAYAGWKMAEVSFEVNARTPLQFATEALKIEAVPYALLLVPKLELGHESIESEGWLTLRPQRGERRR